MPDDIPVGAEILFRGEAPGSTEVSEGKPFVGKAGFVLRSWLIRAVPNLQIALEKGKVGFSNVLKCLPAEQNGRPYPTGQLRRDAEAHCAQFTTIPETVKTIVLCGEVPQRYHFPDELEKEDATDRSLGRDVKGVMGRVGRVYERYYCFSCQKCVEVSFQLTGHIQGASRVFCMNCDNPVRLLRWVFSPHPAYILRQPALVQQGQEALRIAAGDEKFVEPRVQSWDESMGELLCK